MIDMTELHKEQKVDEVKPFQELHIMSLEVRQVACVCCHFLAKL